MTAVQDRIPSEARLREMDGVSFLRAMRDGGAPPPPIATLLKFGIVEVEEGRVVFAATPDGRVYNPLGTVHGGYVCTLLDSCMGCAVHSTLKAGQGYTSVELKVNFVRPLSEATGEVRAEGRVLSTGRQIATAEGRLIDARGRLLAHGTTTCLIFPLTSA
jgi:uncharacterized protein (TIGR00369 family)